MEDATHVCEARDQLLKEHGIGVGECPGQREIEAAVDALYDDIEDGEGNVVCLSEHDINQLVVKHPLIALGASGMFQWIIGGLCTRAEVLTALRSGVDPAPQNHQTSSIRKGTTAAKNTHFISTSSSSSAEGGDGDRMS